MENFVREHTVGSLLRNSFKIYRRHFLTIALVYALPATPVMVFQQEATAAENGGLMLLSMVLSFVVGIFAYAATTVAVSNICLGERPSVARSYGSILNRTTGRLLWANLLQVLAIFAGFLLLLVPGFMAMLFFLFTPITVVLERLGGIAALKRSAALGRGYHWRNLGALLVLFAVFCMLLFGVLLVVFVISLVFVLTGQAPPEILEDHWTSRTVVSLLQAGVVIPVSLVFIVLMYYDLRARKEAYDVRALAEDLRR